MMESNEHLLSDDILVVSYQTLAGKKDKPLDPEMAALDLARGIHKFLNEGKEPSFEAMEHYRKLIAQQMVTGIRGKG